MADGAAEGGGLRHTMPEWEKSKAEHPGVALPVTFEEAKTEILRLRTELARVNAQARALGALAAASDPFGHSHSTLPDGSTVSMPEDEVAGMKAIFDFFDEDESGTISTHELQKLHAKLGEPLTDAEAAEASATIDAEGKGEISFEAFMSWWNGRIDLVQDDDVVGEERARWRMQYAERFKFVKARLASPHIARIFTRTVAAFPSLEYRVNFFHKNKDGTEVQISPWHDIPLKNPDGTYNAVIEIPKWTRAKMEIATREVFNPIKQDTKNGKLRDYLWGDMICNYGAFPQTWEDPKHITKDTGAIGDNDPVDLVEIGHKQWACGSIVKVKVLGVIALIDSGETDWKVVTVSAEDPLAEHMDDISDVPRVRPGLLEALVRWLRLYKSSYGIVNEFGYDGEPQDKKLAVEVIEETHGFWKKLTAEQGKTPLKE